MRRGWSLSASLHWKQLPAAMTVAVAEAGTRETIGGTKRVPCAPGRDVFAHKIDELLAKRERLEEMGSLARETVERKWSMNSAVLRLDSLLLCVARTTEMRQEKSTIVST